MVLTFVYGTLKKGLPNHGLLTNIKNGTANFVCRGTTVQKFPLVIATPYYVPFLLNKPGVGKFIQGEVYDVDDKMLQKLDELENHPVLYVRTPIQVANSDETTLKTIIECNAYVLCDYKESLLDLQLKDTYTADDSIPYISGKHRSPDMKVIDLVKHIPVLK